jgi:putative Ca2+/H+ antiporter (TMEM165/GDT1 family)
MARAADRFGKTFDHSAADSGRGALRSLVFAAGPAEFSLEAFLISTGVVALGEMGDKTQLLAMLLAARFRRPLPIVLGILAATLANHALAGAVGEGIARALGPQWLRWVIGLSFLAMAVWMLVPDRIEDDGRAGRERFGVFGTTLVTFFLAEMGDKTQIATVALAARFDAFIAVVAGTTLGMMLANVPAVYLGERIARRVSMAVVHAMAAGIFALLGVLTLLNVGQLFGS